VVNLYAQLAASAASRSDGIALIMRDRQLSYNELFRDVNRLARAFSSLGIAPGDAVAVLLPNCPEFSVSYYAAVAVGAMCVPANPLLKPAELAYIWNDCGARLVVTAAPLLPGVLEARRHVASLSKVVLVGEADGDVLSFADLLTRQAAQDGASPIPFDGRGGDDPAVCIYTSGT